MSTNSLKSTNALTRRERRSAIIGTVLGDGSLSRNRYRDGSYNGNALLKIAHSIKQKSYLEWKRDIFQPMFGYPLVIQDIYATAKGKRYPVSWLVTRVNTQLTGLYRLMYDPVTGKKRVTEKILNMLDDRAVAIWYMDDGCLSKTVGRGASVILSTNSFTLEENELIRDWIYNRYDVSFNINIHGKSQTYNLRRGISDAHKLLDIIAPYVIESMHYKVDYPLPKKSGGWYTLPTTGHSSENNNSDDNIVQAR